jgi:hypothetical protein
MPRISSITDVDNILVGHFTSPDRPTGCTVITASAPFIAGVDVRGEAPGTREIDLLKPENRADQIDAVFVIMRKCLTVFLWMLAGLCVAAGQTGSPSIVFESTSKNQGGIAQGEIAKQVFTFRNEGTDTLDITSVETS